MAGRENGRLPRCRQADAVGGLQSGGHFAFLPPGGLGRGTNARTSHQDNSDGEATELAGLGSKIGGCSHGEPRQYDTRIC